MSTDTDLPDDGIRPSANGIGALDRVAEDATEWMGRADWGPNHMLNDMGPATVTPSADVIDEDNSRFFMEKSLHRALDAGEESEYDE